MGKPWLEKKTDSETAPGLAVEFSPLEPDDEIDYYDATCAVHVPGGHLLAVQTAQRIIKSTTVSLVDGIDEYSGPAWWMMTESDGRRQEWQISNGLIFIISISTLKDWFHRREVPFPFTAAEVCHQFLQERDAANIKWWNANDYGVNNESWASSPSELRDRNK